MSAFLSKREVKRLHLPLRTTQTRCLDFEFAIIFNFTNIAHEKFVSMYSKQNVFLTCATGALFGHLQTIKTLGLWDIFRFCRHQLHLLTFECKHKTRVCVSLLFLILQYVHDPCYMQFRISILWILRKNKTTAAF